MPSRREREQARIKQAVAKLVPVLSLARQRDQNEAETRILVIDVLNDVLGYDKYEDVTAEQRIRGQYVDFGVRVDGAYKFLIEVKSAGTDLSERHLRQLVSYAINEGIEWAVLTNGCVWQLYHISFTKPIETELVFKIDLTTISDREDDIEHIYLLSKRAVARDEMKDFWEERLALSAPNLVTALFSLGVLDRMRKDFRALTGHRLTVEELRDLLMAEVVRPAVVEQMGGKNKLRRTRRRRASRARTREATRREVK